MTISDEIIGDGFDSSMLIVKAVVTITDGEKSLQVSACAGIDPNRKGMDIAQSFGASSSYARKYALNGTFLIDDTKDADATNTHGKTLRLRCLRRSQRPLPNRRTTSFRRPSIV
jgi:hypothetical protein